MAEQAQLLRPTDDEARELARLLVRGARYMSLAVIDAATGFPSVSRALTAIDLDGTPVVLVSALSGHTKGLLADARCSLLAGEPGKGDPLAHARITVQCLAEMVERESGDHVRIRQRFICRHPKAQLYVDFPDFRFFRLIPQQASLNGGFGRAYALSGDDLIMAAATDESAWTQLQEKLGDLKPQAASLAARLGLGDKNWRFGLADPSGIDLISGDLLVRHEFSHTKYLPDDVMYYIYE
ncbi:pyridoxamine 5'-phosphate oxidase family protein [Aliirhizobium terrae]|uniref:HugZ family pyridoxamine 5'-phosphate oxidase n=1 Tax=Terrirhizobium terrae TaxID=2926709 RepID=UPI0025749067|nr:pyridoxamine 5'-phosphate oxidase family protein [Rhizobium sp. CC-CFT758]WJH40462.1 pyridoxamine 5'-phosphate oxidase family protein [Rhizobium sp. CC-CFT758]